MNRSVDYNKLNEELLFWQQYRFQIFVTKQIPQVTTTNFSVKKILNIFENDNDYYAIGRRISKLVKVKKAIDKNRPK